jgi:glycosyltransferase involved in cell wall biosynthesis
MVIHNAGILPGTEVRLDEFTLIEYDGHILLPRVSIIIIGYNTATYVRRAIESALTQTYRNVEVIYVDDCSTDDIDAALAPYLGKVDIVKHSRNAGPSQARNTGVERATGTILTFLDSDDWFCPNLIADNIEHVSMGNAVCYDSYQVPEQTIQETDIRDTITPDPTWESMFEHTSWVQSELTKETMAEYFSGAPAFKFIVRSDDFHRVGGFDTRFRAMEDFQFCVKLLGAGVRLEMRRDPKAFYLLRMSSYLRSTAISVDKQIEAAQLWQRLFKSMIDDLSLPQEVQHICQSKIDFFRVRETDLRLKKIFKKRQFTNFSELLAGLPHFIQWKASRVLPKGGS